MNSEDLVRALETVPEKRLKLLDLTWEVVDENGEIDRDKVIRLAAEIENAFQEARAYTHDTERVRWGLKTLADR